ncbi:fibrous sheath CABYR-binding protein [Drosophila montana]|uniref:fibrous sheath CABYR-binding protein n=1 Tax=Drosophila montana TaxID=40370 RepID=UPI00313B2939
MSKNVLYDFGSNKSQKNPNDKLFSLSSVLTLSAVASAALAAPQGNSELVDAAAIEYVPPATEFLPLPADATGEQGYEYRTVRRLKLRHRNRRDVSHLPLATQYLPPPPSNRYLPPTAAAAPVLADDTEEVVSAVEPKVARDYLPPAEEPVASTEAPELETEAPPAEEQPVPEVRVADVPTAELRDDGYHYKQPVEMPAELKEAAQEYLPPLGDDVLAEGPANGESSVLTKDGYQYRTIRRYRF